MKDIATTALDPTSADTSKLTGKYLTFTLQSESYGIDVLAVREIIRTVTITAVPQMPTYIKGVINLRGKIIPVTDLRLRLGFLEVKDTEQTCIIVVQVKSPGGKITQMGLVVDGVEEVVNVSAEGIEETPDFGSAISTDYILGIAKIKGSVKALLDINKVLGANLSEQATVITTS
jgi:purine-binding chemotaxis protein CheW